MLRKVGVHTLNLAWDLQYNTRGEVNNQRGVCSTKEIVSGSYRVWLHKMGYKYTKLFNT